MHHAGWMAACTCLQSVCQGVQQVDHSLVCGSRVGNTKKMGAMFGILAAIGGPIPEPETIPYALFIISNRLPAIFKGEEPHCLCLPNPLSLTLQHSQRCLATAY